MKKIFIHIDKLGPIKNVDIELAQLMLFTGASNLGKSYTNFLVYYVFSTFANNRISKFISNKIEGRINQSDNFNFVFKISELCIWMSDDVKSFFQNLLGYDSIPCEVIFKFETDSDILDVVYMKKDEEFEFDNEKLYFSSVKINGNKRVFLADLFSPISIISNSIASFLSGELFGKQIEHAFLLPPGRASLLDNSYSVQKGASKVGMYDLFLRDYDILSGKLMLEEAKIPDKQFFESKISKLIGGELYTSKDGTVLKLKDGTSIPLSAAASSIKELSPILLWMKNRKIGTDSICIEEPEAHAHPEMQYNIADLLVACLNKGAFMQITTHSDYLLSRLNQLIELHKIRQSDELAFFQYCEKYKHTKSVVLDSNLIKAYYFYLDDNNQVKIKQQDLLEGIPFESFSFIVNKQVEIEDALNLYKDKTEDE